MVEVERLVEDGSFSYTGGALSLPVACSTSSTAVSHLYLSIRLGKSCRNPRGEMM